MLAPPHSGPHAVPANNLPSGVATFCTWLAKRVTGYGEQTGFAFQLTADERNALVDSVWPNRDPRILINEFWIQQYA